MFVPITSEVTINTGMVLKEIATERLFEVGRRLSDKEEVWGDDPWELTEVGPGNPGRIAIALPYEAACKEIPRRSRRLRLWNSFKRYHQFTPITCKQGRFLPERIAKKFLIGTLYLSLFSRV